MSKKLKWLESLPNILNTEFKSKFNFKFSGLPGKKKSDHKVEEISYLEGDAVFS